MESESLTEISNLTTGEGAQLENIGSTTISAAQWGYLGAATGAITNTDTNTQLSTEAVQDIVGAMVGGMVRGMVGAMVVCFGWWYVVFCGWWYGGWYGCFRGRSFFYHGAELKLYLNKIKNEACAW